MFRRKNKYGNRKIQVDGITFDSVKEMRMYTELKLMEQAGEVKNLKTQPKYELVPGYTLNGKKVRAIHYIGDFLFWDKRHKRIRLLDCKGFKTEVFKLKEKLFNYKFRNKDLYIEYDI